MARYIFPRMVLGFIYIVPRDCLLLKQRQVRSIKGNAMWFVRLMKIQLRDVSIFAVVITCVFSTGTMQPQEWKEQEGLRMGSELVSITRNWSNGKASTPGT